MVRSMCIITSQFKSLTTLLNAGQKSGGGGGGNARKCGYVKILVNVLAPHQRFEQKVETGSILLPVKEQLDLFN